MWGFEGKVSNLICCGKVVQAHEILRSRLKKDRRINPRYINLLGICEAKMGHFKAAKDLFTHALSLCPGDAKFLNNLGNIFLIELDPDAAIDCYLKAIRKNIWAKEPRYNLVLAYQERGDFEKSMTCFDEYITLKKLHSWLKTIFLGVLFLLLLFFIHG